MDEQLHADAVEEVDVEAYCKQNKQPPNATRYRIRIDREHFVVAQRFITGRELLQLAHKPLTGWRVHQKLRGGQMLEVGLDQQVDLRGPGLERFVTMETAQQDGEQHGGATIASPVPRTRPLRRAFRLPEDDEAYLVGLGLAWETIVESGVRWVLIHEHPVPVGYDQEAVTIAIRIERGYPPSMLDMVYVYPPLRRVDDRSIQALSTQSLEGVVYQRWSRHYAWREWLDTLATHHVRIGQWFIAELKRG